MIIIDF
jgi:DNA polymerase III epsilon subunit family exonuclease